MMATQTASVSSFDYLRRKGSRLGSLPGSPTRKQMQHDEDRHSNSNSNSTINSHHSSTADRDRYSGASTALTAPPAHSKKFVVVGDGGCGKTCLLISYSQGIFPEKYVPTVFENYITHTEHKPSGDTVELALWDTAGQEEYDRLRPLSYPETDLLFVCFAIDCPNSLENVMDKWYPEVMHFCPTTPIILVGLKSDLRNKRTCIELLKTQGLTPISTAQGQSVAKKMGALYMECSSKEMTGVHDIFETAIDAVVSGVENIALTFGANGPERVNTAGGAGSSGHKMGGAGKGPGQTFGKRKRVQNACKIL